VSRIQFSARNKTELEKFFLPVPGLPFLRPNFRNLAFFKVVWHEYMVFGMFFIVWYFLAFFDGVGMEKHCLAFLKPLAQLQLSAWNYRTFSQDKDPLFSTTVSFSKIQAA